MATGLKPRRTTVWQRLFSLASAAIVVLLAYREFRPYPEMWRWSLFGVGLGTLGALTGALVAVAVIVYRGRTAGR